MEWHRLDPRARWLFYGQSAMGLVFFWWPVAAVAAAVVGTQVSWVWGLVLGVGLAVLTLLSAVWMPSLRYERWAYALREDDLLIARGVLVRTITAIPWSRIQHVDTGQGPLDQLLGLAQVQIYTASGMGADGVIPGLRLPVAEALRDQLLRAGGDDGV